MAEKKMVPAVRFAEFTDAWEQRKVGEFANVLSASRVHKDEWVTSGVPFYRSSDVVSAFKGNDNERAFISIELYKELVKVSGKLEKDDILITGGGSIGIPFIVPNSEPLYSKDADLIWIKRSEEHDSAYLYAYFASHLFREFIGSISHVGTIAHYTIEQVKDTPVRLPSIAEQRAIGSFFHHLDHLITLHQRKCEKLKNIKKSMLEKMFPREGASVPEIRFAEFTDAWEQRKFSEITFLAGVKNKDNLPLESYSITNEDGFIPQDEKFENGGTMRDADKRMYYIVPPHSFAYNPARINVGSIGYQNLSKKVIVSSLYEVFQTTENIDDRFLWHWFKSPDFQKLIEQLQEGGVRLYFYYDKLCMGTLSFPCLEEQRRIGRYLDAIDHLITLHQRKLEKLQSIKKSMLEKMFV